MTSVQEPPVWGNQIFLAITTQTTSGAISVDRYTNQMGDDA